MDECPECHRFEEDIHLGKMSAGWQFLWQRTDEWQTVADIEAALPNGEIRNEYGDVFTPVAFIAAAVSHERDGRTDFQEGITDPNGHHMMEGYWS